tara:strand:- start:25 stop:465 length:441 start_codon:yes stop_codon:yes gene_type:complete
MILISHRGNITGKTKHENHPDYILKALKLGYDVEIDVWNIAGDFYLGHDNPQYLVKKEFLKTQGLWCHAKNPMSLVEMAKNPWIHYFWHEEDQYTLTSRGKIWIYPDKKPLEDGILVLQEEQLPPDNIRLAGVCSDFVSIFRKLKK